MTGERIIEVEVTAEDLEKMRAEGVDEADLPEIGIKRYRPARHIIKDKVATLLNSIGIRESKEDELGLERKRPACIERVGAKKRVNFNIAKIKLGYAAHAAFASGTLALQSFFQSRINQELRQIMEREKVESL